MPDHTHHADTPLSCITTAGCHVSVADFRLWVAQQCHCANGYRQQARQVLLPLPGQASYLLLPKASRALSVSLPGQTSA